MKEDKISQHNNLKQKNPVYKRLGILLLIFLGIIGVSFLPEFFQNKDSTQGYKYMSEFALGQANILKINVDELKPLPLENTLVIPKIDIDAPIVEGESIEALNRGIWHRPYTSSPEFGGNMVLAGHRYMDTQGGSTFYHLDKLEIGDPIIIFWKGKEYVYQVIEVKTVLATAMEIEQNTEDELLTLYTCTPLFSSEERLVVLAKPL